MSVPTTISQQNTAEVVPTSLELAITHYFHNRLKNNCWDEFNIELWQQALPQTAHSSAVIWHATTSYAGSMWARDKANPPAEMAEAFHRESCRQFSLCVKGIKAITQCPQLLPREKTTVLLANMTLSMALRTGFPDLFTQMRAKSHELIRLWNFWKNIDSDAQAMQVLYFWLKSEDYRHECLFVAPERHAVIWREASHTCRNGFLPLLLGHV